MTESAPAPYARLFFALAPDRAVRAVLQARRRALRLSGRPVAGARLHATLVFLGNQPPGRIATLQRLAAALAFPDVCLDLDRLGCFEAARAAWMGASRLPPALLDFRAGLVASLDANGFDFDHRPWVFHVTLYRDLRTPCVSMPLDPLRWTPRRLVLMESVRGPAGSHYRALGRWPSGGLNGRLCVRV